MLRTHGVELTVQAVRKWFDGDSLPSMHNLSVLASLLKTDASYLLTGNPVSSARPEALSAEDVELLAAFRQLDAIERLEVLSDTQMRARRLDLRQKQKTPPKAPPSDLSRDRRAG